MFITGSLQYMYDKVQRRFYIMSTMISCSWCRQCGSKLIFNSSATSKRLNKEIYKKHKKTKQKRNKNEIIHFHYGGTILSVTYFSFWIFLSEFPKVILQCFQMKSTIDEIHGVNISQWAQIYFSHLFIYSVLSKEMFQISIFTSYLYRNSHTKLFKNRNKNNMIYKYLI